MTAKINLAICGDSFCVTDDRYPGLSWVEKLLDSNENMCVSNYAHGGCSNAMIAMQVMHALTFRPDVCIISFTDHARYEFDDKIDFVPYEFTAAALTDYVKQRYTTNKYGKNKIKNKLTDDWRAKAASDSFEVLKNYFYIVMVLELLRNSNTRYIFSLGGFEWDFDYHVFLNKNFLPNQILSHQSCQLKTNLWYYQSNCATQPFFHIVDESVHRLFANECLSHIIRDKIC